MTTSQFSFTKLFKLRNYHWTRSFYNINMKLDLAFSNLKILTLNITSSSLFQKNRILKPINFHFFHLIVKNCFKKCESFFFLLKKKCCKFRSLTFITWRDGLMWNNSQIMWKWKIRIVDWFLLWRETKTFEVFWETQFNYPKVGKQIEWIKMS